MFLQYGIDHVRGAEVEGMLDEQGKVIEEGTLLVSIVQFIVRNKPFSLIHLGPEPKPELKGESRTFRVWLDTNQYQQDMAATVQGTEVCIYYYWPQDVSQT